MPSLRSPDAPPASRAAFASCGPPLIPPPSPLVFYTPLFAPLYRAPPEIWDSSSPKLRWVPDWDGPRAGGSLLGRPGLWKKLAKETGNTAPPPLRRPSTPLKPIPTNFFLFPPSERIRQSPNSIHILNNLVFGFWVGKRLGCGGHCIWPCHGPFHVRPLARIQRCANINKIQRDGDRFPPQRGIGLCPLFLQNQKNGLVNEVRGTPGKEGGPIFVWSIPDFQNAPPPLPAEGLEQARSRNRKKLSRAFSSFRPPPLPGSRGERPLNGIRNSPHFPACGAGRRPVFGQAKSGSAEKFGVKQPKPYNPPRPPAY